MGDAVVEVRGLTVSTTGGIEIVSDVALRLGGGEILGLAGESGSGKSTLIRAMLGYARPGTTIASGAVLLSDGAGSVTDLLRATPGELRRLRGRRVAYVAQDSARALNPAHRVGALVAELRRVHGLGCGADEIRSVLAQVNLPTDAGFVDRYPHQLSGGQQQRLAIGLAVACQPQLILLDEPTSGLDVVTQRRILDEVGRLCRADGLAAVLVSHDLAAMASIAERICVMYAGRIVEERPTGRLLAAPAHPYSVGLIASVPDHAEPKVLVAMPGVAVGIEERPDGCAFALRCGHVTDACRVGVPALADLPDGGRVRCLHADRVVRPETVRRVVDQHTAGGERSPALLAVESLRAVHGQGRAAVVAADGVSFSVAPGECVALVGESGSGKSTIARCVAGLHRPAGGTIAFAGRPVAGRAGDRPVEVRRAVQIVFQNPDDSLNPVRTVAQALDRPLRLFRPELDGAGRAAERRDLLDRVRLPGRIAGSLPAELSGGERQRVAIARALAARPRLLVCDEITSALDVSVQAAVLDVLGRLDVTILFITHDLGVVASIADSVVVLERGRVREQGPVETVIGAPRHAYTRALIEAIPLLEPEASRP